MRKKHIPFIILGLLVVGFFYYRGNYILQATSGNTMVPPNGNSLPSQNPGV